MTRIIFFDGHCRICNGFSSSILKTDQKRLFQFASLHSNKAKELLTEQDLSRDSVIFYVDGKTYTETAAVILILQTLGGAHAQLARALEIVPQFIRDAVYRGIARIRFYLQAKQPLTCDMTQNSQLSLVEMTTLDGLPRFLD